MGDLIELTTWPSHENIFYEITSSAFTFYVKSSRNVVIGLSRTTNRNCDYWIVISNNSHSYIKKASNPATKVHTPGILNSEDFQKFWLTWYGSCIRLGSGDAPNPFLMCLNKVPGLQYITFDIRTRRERNPVHWRFELPPVLHKPRFKSITGGGPQWVTASNRLPDGAVIGGYQNEVLFVIRASHRGSLTPGKFAASSDVAFIPWGGSENEKSDFEVLCGYDLAWVPTHNDRIPVNAVVGGYSEDDGREKLYIGRSYHEGHLIPGKVQPSHKICYLPYNNREIAKSYYEILVVPHGNARYANKHFSYNFEIETGSESDYEEEINEQEIALENE